MIESTLAAMNDYFDYFDYNNDYSLYYYSCYYYHKKSCMYFSSE